MTKVQPRVLADLIKRPIITEKATVLLENNQYVFDVDRRATKPQIKAAIEDLFNVTVTGVNTYNLPKKQKRVGRFIGHRSQYKRAIVTLAPDNKINLFPDV